MKYIIATSLMIFTIFFTGCSIDDLPFLSKESQNISNGEEELKYKVNNVILSKGYQTIEPNVEIIKKNKETQLLINVGLLETSGVNVDKLTKDGNTINIHVSNQVEDENLQLAVPQILLDLKDANLKDLETIKFNIINENFQPINLKLKVTDAINKVRTDFHVTSNTIPEIELRKVDDNYIWNITYYSIFDKNNPETPLVNLSVELNANTAELLQSTKGLISTYIDDGHILDYISDKSVLYRKSDIDPITSAKTESIYSYDIESNKSTKLYFTSLDILTACYSPDEDYIYVLEGNDSANQLFIVDTKDQKAYKVLIDDTNTPHMARWKDKNNLLILVKDRDITKIYNYNVDNDNNELVAKLDMNISDFRANDDTILLLDDFDAGINENIYITEDWESFDQLDSGFNIRFINDEILVYLKNNEKNDRSILNLYDLKKKESLDTLDINVSSVSKASDNLLFITEKNQGNSDFNLYDYKPKEKELNFITKVNNENIYYDSKKNLLYVNLLVPFESENQEIIFSIDLEKLVNTNP